MESKINTDSGLEKISMIAFRCPTATREQLKEWCFENGASVGGVLLEVVGIMMDEGDWLGEELRERLIGSGVRFGEV